MFRRVRRRTLEWRRVAQFEPVRVEGARFAEQEGAERPNCGGVPQPGMRVALKREPRDEHGRPRVVVESLDERKLGYLTEAGADWAAPLLDSNRVAIEGRVYAVEPATPGSKDSTPNLFVSLIQFELVPIKVPVLIRAIRGLVHFPVRSARWCFERVLLLEHAVGRNPMHSPGFDPPSGDRFATEDKSGG